MQEDDARSQVQDNGGRGMNFEVVTGGVPDTDNDAAAAAEGGQVQDRADIQARLRRAQEVMETVTWTNRTQRIRQPRNFYQAGTKEREKGPG